MNVARTLLPVTLGAALCASAWAGDGPACAGRPAACEAAPVTTSACGLVSIEVERELPAPRWTPLLPGANPLLGWGSALGLLRSEHLEPERPGWWPRRIVVARGAGFVARADGLVVTPRGLVGDAAPHQRVMVSLPDGRRLEAERLGEDGQLVLLRVDAAGLTVFPFAGVEDLMARAAPSLPDRCQPLLQMDWLQPWFSSPLEGPPSDPAAE